LANCTQHLVSHGGHAAAAGLKIEAANVDHFRADFCEHAAGAIAVEKRTAELWIDAEVGFGELTMQSVVELERLAPFGQSNPRPLLCASGVTLAGAPQKIGGGGRHLSLKLAQHGVTLRGVAFGGGDWAEELVAAEGPLSVAFRPIINDFRGRRTVELQLADWQVAQPASIAGAVN
jgi:single-stranded-DNA-specific exonuclease